MSDKSICTSISLPSLRVRHVVASMNSSDKDCLVAIDLHHEASSSCNTRAHCDNHAYYKLCSAPLSVPSVEGVCSRFAIELFVHYHQTQVT